MVKASITGSIIGNILLVLGLSMVAGGVRFPIQAFNRTAASMGASLLLLSAIGLEQGDEDTIVNWLLFGTSFTTQPRAVMGAVEANAADQHAVLRRTVELIGARLDDLITALATPGTDERRLFARRFLEQQGLPVRDRGRAAGGTRAAARRDHARGARTGTHRSGARRDERAATPSSSSSSGRGCSVREACRSIPRCFRTTRSSNRWRR